MADQKQCNDQNCQCGYHQIEAGFVVTEIIEVDPKNNANFQIPKKHLGDVEKVIIKKNTKTMKKKVELFGNAKPEQQPKKPKKPPTDQQIIEQLADLNHKFEFIIEQFQLLNQKVQNESEKNEKRWEKIQQKVDGLEQKVDDGFSQVNQRLDKIENCPTIKKELAEQNEQVNNLNENEQKSDETDKSSTNDKKDEENN